MTVRQILQSAADKGVQLALFVNDEGKEKLNLVHAQTPESERAAERVRAWVRTSTPEVREAIFAEIRAGGTDLVIPEFRGVDGMLDVEPSDAVEGAYQVPARVAEPRPERPASDPVLYETPEMQQARRLREGLEALTKNTARVSVEVEEGLTVEWKGEGFNIGAGVFIYPDGRRSMHWFEVDSYSEELRCDCKAKKMNLRVPCKHEILREKEINRRASEALIKAGDTQEGLEL